MPLAEATLARELGSLSRYATSAEAGVAWSQAIANYARSATANVPVALAVDVAASATLTSSLSAPTADWYSTLATALAAFWTATVLSVGGKASPLPGLRTQLGAVEPALRAANSQEEVGAILARVIHLWTVTIPLTHTGNPYVVT